jgi:hypothetical protein
MLLPLVWTMGTIFKQIVNIVNHMLFFCRPFGESDNTIVGNSGAINLHINDVSIF